MTTTTRWLWPERKFLTGEISTMSASDVRVGDCIVLPNALSVVADIETFDLAYHEGEPIKTSTGRWTVLKFSGSYNIVRFPQETLSVIRPVEQEQS